eukprot:1079328-Rhodomonas_salina.2
MAGTSLLTKAIPRLVFTGCCSPTLTVTHSSFRSSSVMQLACGGFESSRIHSRTPSSYMMAEH